MIRHHEEAVDHPTEEIEARLQAQGISASAVQNSPELTRDPQLAQLVISGALG